MPYVDQSISTRALGTYVGKTHECVSLVVAWAGVRGGTGSWSPGLKVMEHASEIPKGTAIATFVHGQYPSDERHAAIFLDADATGIDVIEQFQGQVSQRRHIHFGSHGRQNDPNAYYVIE
jgi:hypothetical protein